MKQYKALMLDVDGTIVDIHNFEALPSDKVQNAIKKAKEKLHVGIVTSRPLFIAKKIITSLELSGPCIVQGGAQLVNGGTLEIIRRHPLPYELIMQAYEISKKYGIELHVDYEKGHVKITDNFPDEQEFYGVVTLPAVEVDRAESYMKELEKIPSLAVFKTVIDNKQFVFATHKHSTKQHGILEAAEILGISTHEIIGVGDGYNDFPMLMACGLKVAMGNAVPELKAIADYIAPPIDQDGVANVIEKFVL